MATEAHSVFIPPPIVPPGPGESIQSWRKSYEAAIVVYKDAQAIALLPTYCNRNEAERTAAKIVAKECEKKTLKEALDVLVNKTDGPKKPDEAARKFFKMVKKVSESLFSCMYALRVLAEEAEIPSEIVAQKFVADLAPEIRTAILKDNEGKNYKSMDLDKLLNLARQKKI